MKARKVIGWSALAMAVVLVGCMSSATAWTEKRTTKDGVIIERSKVSIIGTGDKASQIASEGVFADGGIDDLGAGVKKASASQQSSGIDGTLRGIGELLGGVAQLMEVQRPMISTLEYRPVDEIEGNRMVWGNRPTTGYNGVPGEGGVGVYGRWGCGRTRAYQERHGVEIVDVDVGDHLAVLRQALRVRGKASNEGLAYPIVVTEDSYIERAR